MYEYSLYFKWQMQITTRLVTTCHIHGVLHVSNDQTPLKEAVC